MAKNDYYLALLLTILMLMAGCSVALDYNTCQACNCRVNNAQVLEELVEQKVNIALAKLPGIFQCARF